MKIHPLHTFHKNLDCGLKAAVYLGRSCVPLVAYVKVGHNMMRKYWKFSQFFIKQTKKGVIDTAKNKLNM